MIKNYEMFKNIITPLFEGVSYFYGYELIRYLLENVEEEQASYLVKFLKETKIIRCKFFDHQNPLLIIQNVNNFYEFVYNFSCKRNVYYFFKVTELILLSSINLRNLINLYFSSIVNEVSTFVN